MIPVKTWLLRGHDVSKRDHRLRCKNEYGRRMIFNTDNTLDVINWILYRILFILLPPAHLILAPTGFIKA